MIGQSLRHYRIEAKLGSGGMGVVYRARDTHLDRPAAIKVLPAAALGNAERRARFAQEAKSASALSHRHIVTIYDVDTGQIDGQPVDFIAMEFVAGRTLDRVIGRKGLRLNEALRYAVQIADGLSAAHAAGIVHRDLKPANVMVNEQGEVKILDFGLAKLAEPEPPDVHAATESVHIEAALKTEAGTIIGTVAYMSPEQADGRKVDERSDIFSLGAVLYEMITGHRAFGGDSKLSTLAAVLHTEPAPLDQAGQPPPREIQRIIARCLRKDPQRRWQSMADLKVALEDALAELDAAPTTETAPVRPRRRILNWVLGPAAIVLALAGGALVGSRMFDRARPSFERLTYRRGNVAAARFSPDGQMVVFSAQWANEPTTVFSMRPGGRESRPLDLPPARILSISSSGEMALLLGAAAPGTLARVSLSGGAPREILENVNDADWSPNGAELAVSRTIGRVNRVEYPIGTVLYETAGPPPSAVRVSPQGDAVAFIEYDPAIGDFAISVVDLKRANRVLSRGWKAEGSLGWSPRGNEIWYGGTKPGGDPALHGVTLTGKERLIVETPAFMAVKDITRSGKVLVTAEDSRIGIAGLAPGAAQERDLGWFDASRVSDMAADGNTILFVELSNGRSRIPAIYLRKTDGSQAVRLGEGDRPSLSRDGKWVACILGDGPAAKLTLLPTGAGQAQTIGSAGLRYERVEWFPDGQRLLVTAGESNHPSRTFVQGRNGGTPAPLTPEGTTATAVSPDQNWVVVVSEGKLNLLPVSGGAARPVADLDPTESVIRWSADGRSLYLRRLESPTAMKVVRLDVATGRKQLWKEFKPPDPVGVQMGSVVLTPDGAAYAYSYQRNISTLYLVSSLK